MCVGGGAVLPDAAAAAAQSSPEEAVGRLPGGAGQSKKAAVKDQAPQGALFLLLSES